MPLLCVARQGLGSYTYVRISLKYSKKMVSATEVLGRGVCGSRSSITDIVSPFSALRVLAIPVTWLKSEALDSINAPRVAQRAPAP
jgi:hypothetical protein